MICISVTPTSRTLAPADLLNASRLGDVIELCMDHFIKEPNIGELIKAVDKPILVSCRRPQDGGNWKGTEEERLQLLRTAIVAGPAYVELELDIAARIPRFGRTQRVISWTSLDRSLGGIDGIYDQCVAAGADIIKVTWPTDDLDAAWPMLAAVTKPRPVPVVGLGLGRSGITFSLLGRKYGSPWIYAALERGMEAFEGQPRVWQLKEDYHWHEVHNKTRFVAIIGFGEGERLTARVLNAAFAAMDKPIRCLPIQPRDISRLPKMLSMMKINGMVVDPTFEMSLSSFVEAGDDLARQSGFMDVVMERSEGWRGHMTLFDGIREAGAEITGQADWHRKGSVLVLGKSNLARAAAMAFLQSGAAVSLAAPSDNAASSVAREVGVRQVAWNSVHDIRMDTLVLADRDLICGTAKGQLNPMLMRERINAIDLTRFPEESPFGDEARLRGSRYFAPRTILRHQLNVQFRTLTGRDLPEEAVREAATA